MKHVYEDVKRINKIDPATHSERLGKLAEEFGELAQAVNKTSGRKIHTNTEEEIREELKGEIADVIQNVFSIADGYSITYEEIVETLLKKNVKWEQKVNVTKR